MNLPESKLTKNQIKRLEKIKGNKRLVVKIRHDDECGNGHNTFAITATLSEKAKNGQWVWQSGGCLHKEVAAWFPELAPLLKWHLCSTDGPMHYLANTMYHAGDRDCWGLRKGEPRSYDTFLQFEVSPGIYFPITYKVGKSFAAFLKKFREGRAKLDIMEVAHPKKPETFGPSYTFANELPCAWHECIFSGARHEAEEMQAALSRFKFELIQIPTSFGGGKEPDLEAARASAIWPEATLEQLQDKEALLKRLWGLMVEFKEAVESLGFEY